MKQIMMIGTLSMVCAASVYGVSATYRYETTSESSERLTNAFSVEREDVRKFDEKMCKELRGDLSYVVMSLNEDIESKDLESAAETLKSFIEIYRKHKDMVKDFAADLRESNIRSGVYKMKRVVRTPINTTT